jgi:hypothetical protein
MVTVFWATWHYYRQDLGVLSLYRKQQGMTNPKMIHFDRCIVGLFSLFNPIHYWLRTGYRYFILKPYINSAWMDQFVPWWSVRAFGTFVLLAYLVAQLRLKSLKTPRSLFVLVLYAQFLSMTPLSILPPFTEYLTRIVTHNSVELGIQSRMWSGLRKNKTLNQQIVLALGFAVALTALFMGSIYIYPFIGPIVRSGYFNIEYFLKSKHRIYIAVAVGFMVGINWFHYVIGRAIYDFRRASLRQLFQLRS